MTADQPQRRESRPLCGGITEGPDGHPCRYPVRHGLIRRGSAWWEGYCGVHIVAMLGYAEAADALPWEELGPGAKQAIRERAQR